MNDKIKMGLLAVIAIATLTNTYLLISNSGPSSGRSLGNRVPGSNTAAATPAGAQQASLNNPAAQSNPILPPAQPAVPAGPLTSVKFAQMSHSFGTIKQDSENAHTFQFTNTGDEPLVIENAKGSCGCTVPDYPKEPIAPGATAEINVVYKPGKQKGKQTKNVTVTANTEPRQTVLTISAEVEEVAAQ